jgi:hypothetical protein
MRVFLAFFFCALAFADQEENPHEKNLDRESREECFTNVKDWYDYQKEFENVTALPRLEKMLNFIFNCSRKEDLSAIFADEKLKACLGSAIQLAERVTSIHNASHRFEIENLHTITPALFEYALSGDPKSLSAAAKKVPGIRAFQYKQSTSPDNVPLASIIDLPQSDGSHVLLNLGSGNAVMKLTTTEPRTVRYGLLVDVGGEAGLILNWDQSHGCAECHVTGFIPVEKFKSRAVIAKNAYPPAQNAASLAAAINKQFTGQYNEVASAEGIPCIGPEKSKFREEMLLGFLQKNGITSDEQIQLVQSNMNCSSCHTGAKGDSNKLCYPFRPFDQQFNVFQHSIVDTERMPKKEDAKNLSHESRIGLAKASSYEYYGQLDPQASTYKFKWRGLLLDSILAVPCP